MQIPDIHYTKVDGLSIAWQQYGSGPDVLLIPGLVSNIELVWEHEFYRRVQELLAKHVRTTVFDKPGMGLSERTHEHQTIEQRMADVLAVMDAAGLERTHVLGISEGGLIAQIFAARWLERFQRLSGTQRDVIRQIEDVSSLMAEDPATLSAIVAPTLIINSSRDRIIDPASGDWLHERIARSEQIGLDPEDHFMWLSDLWVEVCSIIVEVFSGAPIVPAAERRLGSVVFTDLVNSTAATAEAGDHAWSKTLQEHDAIAWSLANRHAGTIIKSTGDGLLVLFSTPHEAISFCDGFRSAVEAEGLHIRAGIHSGEVELIPNGDITGFAVNLAARVEQAADDGTVWVSSTVRDMLMGGSHQFAERGEHALKGFEDPWRLYELAAS